MINNHIFEPIEIFDQNHGEIDYDNLCPICYDQIEVNTSYTLECNHKFHTDCIVKWLRSEHSNCPMCNGVVNENERIYYRMDNQTKLKLILNYSRRKTASKKVVNIVNKYKKKNKEFLKAKKEFTEFKRTYKNIIKQKREFATKIWRLRRAVEKMKRDIKSIPIQPVIIK
jgi:hypothetical protein